MLAAVPVVGAVPPDLFAVLGISGNLGEDLGHVDLTVKAPSHVNLTVPTPPARR